MMRLHAITPPSSNNNDRNPKNNTSNEEEDSDDARNTDEESDIRTVQTNSTFPSFTTNTNNTSHISINSTNMHIFVAPSSSGSSFKASEEALSVSNPHKLLDVLEGEANGGDRGATNNAQAHRRRPLHHSTTTTARPTYSDGMSAFLEVAPPVASSSALQTRDRKIKPEELTGGAGTPPPTAAPPLARFPVAPTQPPPTTTTLKASPSFAASSSSSLVVGTATISSSPERRSGGFSTTTTSSTGTSIAAASAVASAAAAAANGGGRSSPVWVTRTAAAAAVSSTTNTLLHDEVQRRRRTATATTTASNVRHNSPTHSKATATATTTVHGPQGPVVVLHRAKSPSLPHWPPPTPSSGTSTSSTSTKGNMLPNKENDNGHHRPNVLVTRANSPSSLSYLQTELQRRTEILSTASFEQKRPVDQGSPLLPTKKGTIQGETTPTRGPTFASLSPTLTHALGFHPVGHSSLSAPNSPSFSTSASRRNANISPGAARRSSRHELFSRDLALPTSPSRVGVRSSHNGSPSLWRTQEPTVKEKPVSTRAVGSINANHRYDMTPPRRSRPDAVILGGPKKDRQGSPLYSQQKQPHRIDLSKRDNGTLDESGTKPSSNGPKNPFACLRGGGSDQDPSGSKGNHKEAGENISALPQETLDRNLVPKSNLRLVYPVNQPPTSTSNVNATNRQLDRSDRPSAANLAGENDLGLPAFPANFTDHAPPTLHAAYGLDSSAPPDIESGWPVPHAISTSPKVPIPAVVQMSPVLSDEESSFPAMSYQDETTLGGPSFDFSVSACLDDDGKVPFVVYSNVGQVLQTGMVPRQQPQRTQENDTVSQPSGHSPPGSDKDPADSKRSKNAIFVLPDANATMVSSFAVADDSSTIKVVALNEKEDNKETLPQNASGGHSFWLVVCVGLLVVFIVVLLIAAAVLFAL